MASTALDYLRNLRIDEIMEDTQDKRVLPGNLVFLNRLNRNPAANSELIAKHQGRVQIAPMIATNAKAPVFKADKYRVESNTLGKIKYGTSFDEDEMEEWMDLQRSAIRDPQGILGANRVSSTLMTQLKGIEHQMEWLAVAMALDGKLGSSTYNRFGYFLENVTWGRYDDLKADFPIALEANPTTCKPISYILAMKQRREEKYGEATNRMTLGTSTLRAIYLTTEYQTMAKPFLPVQIDYGSLPTTDNKRNREILSMVLEGMEVVTYDTRYWNETDSGTWSSTRFWPNTPTAPIELSDSAQDNTDEVADFGVGMAMEGMMAGMGAGMGDSQVIGGPDGGKNRVISYGTVSPRLDPPGLTLYSVMKGFPRLYDRASNAVLYAGPITELLTVNDDLNF
jgi:hypothetical protein